MHLNGVPHSGQMRSSSGTSTTCSTRCSIVGGRIILLFPLVLVLEQFFGRFIEELFEQTVQSLEFRDRLVEFGVQFADRLGLMDHQLLEDGGIGRNIGRIVNHALNVHDFPEGAMPPAPVFSNFLENTFFFFSRSENRCLPAAWRVGPA